MSEGGSEATSWWALDAARVVERLRSGASGLAEEEAARRLAEVGPNRIDAEDRVHPLALLLHQFASPLVYVLLAAAAVSVAIRHWEDAIVIGIVLVLNAAIGFTQEHRAEGAMRALGGLVAPRAVVRRGGRRRDVPSAELVPGDVVLLESGGAVPADLRLLETERLSIEESTFTGESLPASKSAEALPADRPIPVADRSCMAFLGTTVAAGRGRGVVVATGAATELGRIAVEMRGAERAETPLTVRMRRFANRISVAIVLASGLAFLLGLARGTDAPEMFLTAVAIAVAAMPEGLPVVMTITLAVSVRRMARRNAIVRRLPAVETLGSCSVIVSDKTGTLTLNRMVARDLWVSGERVALSDAAAAGSEPARRLLETAALVNEAELDGGEDGTRAVGDPTEVALLDAARVLGIDPAALRDTAPVERRVPFEPERRFAASVHRTADGLRACVKGAPERVIAMCDRVLGSAGEAPLDADRALAAAEALARRGLRVLALAGEDEPSRAARVDPEEPADLVLLGLVGLHDPPRPRAKEAIAACHAAGIRVLMVTGDHATTAEQLARAVGLAAEGEPVVDGPALAAMSDAELAVALERGHVFARVAPAEKLRIVERLRTEGEVVAVTGDGVNDAPALKAAHVGAAMGASGTDVAREASEIVLADDDFATVAAAVEEGRTAFSNLRKATFFLVSSGGAELLSIVASLVVGLPLPYLPAQILWLNVVTNGIQDVALAFEPAEGDGLRRPPRPLDEGILSRRLVLRSLIAGIVMAAGTLALFLFEWGGDPERLAHARTAALTTMVLFQAVHVGNARSEDASLFARSPFSNPFLFVGVAGALGLHAAALYLPATQRLLGLVPLEGGSWLRALGVALTVAVAVEIDKWVRARRAPAGGSS